MSSFLELLRRWTPKEEYIPMRLSYTGRRWEFNCSVMDSNLPKKANFHWDRTQRVWWTGLIEIARQLQQYADASAKASFVIAQARVARSRATTSNLIIPCPDGLEYLPFQKAGIEISSQRNNNLLADEMGLGKTIQACGYINMDPSINNVLIITPASLRLNWQRELEKWLTRRLTGGFAASGYLADIPDTNIVIINYEIVAKLRSYIDERKWDLVLCDEAHYLKSPTSQRTCAVLGSDDPAKPKQTPPIETRKWMFLTGTPILNRPVELWPILRTIDKNDLGASLFLYGKRYCGAFDGVYGWDFTGATNLDQLQEHLRSSIMIRRLKKDVLKDLPPKRRQIIPVPADRAAIAAMQSERQFFEANERDISVAVEEARAEANIKQAAGNRETYNNAASILQGVRGVLFTQMAALRHATALAKVPYVIEHADNVLAETDKIVIFAHHQDVIKQIAEHYKSACVVISGMEPDMVKRQASIDAFQTDPKKRVAIVSIQAGGIGITLNVASYGLFAEISWVPGELNQAEDRLHRIGQKSACLFHHLVFDNSLDAIMVKRVIEKQEQIEAALDTEPTIQ